MTNIGTGFVSSSSMPDKPIVEEISNTAITVDWFQMEANSTLNLSKMPSQEANYGCSVSLPASSLNIALGTEVNIIVSAYVISQSSSCS